jgi:hypothetical protein
MAKANFSLCVRLAQIAGEEGEECLRIGGKAMFAVADHGRTAATSVMPAGEAFDFLAEVRKGQQRIGGDVAKAFEEWQRCWMAAMIPSDVETGLAMPASLVSLWFGRVGKA